LTPRISFSASSASQDIFAIRLHSAVEKHDLVVYTSNTFWAMDLATWVALSKDLVGPAVTVTVSATSTSGGAVTTSSPASFTIASLEAQGALIYWTTASHDPTATSTSLNGFHVGDTGSAQILTSSQVTQPVVASPVDGGNTTNQEVGVFCIGCHTSTPKDENGNVYVAFTAQWPWANALASPAPATVGQPPTWLTTGAIANMSPVAGPASGNTAWYEPPEINQVMLGIQTFSPLHFSATDRIVITTLGAAENAVSLTSATTQTGVVSQLAWINLGYTGPVPTDGGLPVAPCGTDPAPPSSCLPTQTPNGGWGLLERGGSADLGSAGAPSWSHGVGGIDYVAYTTSTAGTKDGRMNDGPADIAIIPYNSRGAGLGGMGGTAIALPGASDPAFNEYYPAWSPDDTLIAFNRVPSGLLMYNQPAADLFVVPSDGNAATCDGVAAAQCNLKANVPVTCTGSTDGTVQNTWPKWAPLPTSNGNTGSDGNHYYWVTFSSTRINGCTMPGSNVCSAADVANATGKSQLYVAGIVTSPNGSVITTFPAIYLWNQDFLDNNLIPAWDYFPLPSGTGNIPPPK
jgi:hypothetical protein